MCNEFLVRQPSAWHLATTSKERELGATRRHTFAEFPCAQSPAAPVTLLHADQRFTRAVQTDNAPQRGLAALVQSLAVHMTALARANSRSAKVCSPQLDHVAIPVPSDVGLYDIQTTLPGLVGPTSAGLDALMEFGPDGIDAILQQVWAATLRTQGLRPSRTCSFGQHQIDKCAFTEVNISGYDSSPWLAVRRAGGRGAAAPTGSAAHPGVGGAPRPHSAPYRVADTNACHVHPLLPAGCLRFKRSQS